MGRDDGDVTVVVLTRDRPLALARTLNRLGHLGPRPPVIVVDNGSRITPVRAMVRRLFPWVRLIALPRDRGAAGRNVGAQAARTPFVAFCDDDSWWCDGALARAAAVMRAHPGVGAVCARVLVGPFAREDPYNAQAARSPLPRGPDGMPAVAGFLACGVVVHRGAFLGTGGFERRFGIGGEEELLAIDMMRRGHRLVYDAGVVAHHHPPRRGGGNTERRRRQVRNALWSAWLRRPVAGAVATTARAVGAAARDRTARGGLADAVRDGRWVIAERRPVARRLDRMVAEVAEGP